MAIFKKIFWKGSKYHIFQAIIQDAGPTPPCWNSQ